MTEIFSLDLSEETPQQSEYGSNWNKLSPSKLTASFSMTDLEAKETNGTKVDVIGINGDCSVSVLDRQLQILDEDSTFGNEQKAGGCPNPCDWASRRLRRLCGRTETDAQSCSSSAKTCLFTLFPILSWLSTYSIRKYLPYDILAGLTVFALQVPQGLAYGRLAGAEPINGLYVAIFPVIIYAIFGGSYHVSMGPMMVFGIACHDAIAGVIQQPGGNGTGNAALDSGADLITPVQALATLCLCCGLVQALVGVFRLGIIANLFSDVIMASFLTACATLIITSQACDLFGIDGAARPDDPTLINSYFLQAWYRFFTRLDETNLAVLLLSIICTGLIVFSRYFLEPFLQRRLKLKTVVIPIDLILMVLVGLIQWAFRLHHHFNIALIPETKGSFAHMPITPRLELIPSLLPSGIMLGFIMFANAFLVGKLFAQKYAYQVEPNQEFWAMGLSNIFACFFLCLPFAGSLSRTTIQDKVGCKTQVTGLISALLILLLILFLSHLLAQVPMCVLSCIVCMALDRVMMKIVEVWHYWRQSHMDGTIWAVTYLCVIILGMRTGLLYAIGVALLIILKQLMVPNFSVKSPCDSVLIFKFYSPLMFINANKFGDIFERHVIETLHKRTPNTSEAEFKDNDAQDTPTEITTTVIIDMSPISFAHSQGLKCLANLRDQLKLQSDAGATGVATHRAQLYLAALQAPLYEAAERTKFFNVFPKEECFASVRDALRRVADSKTN